MWVEGLLQHADPLIVRGGIHHQGALVFTIEYCPWVTRACETILLVRFKVNEHSHWTVSRGLRGSFLCRNFLPCPYPEQVRMCPLTTAQSPHSPWERKPLACLSLPLLPSLSSPFPSPSPRASQRAPLSPFPFPPQEPTQ